MLRFVLAHLRARPGRSTALLVGILVATTGFTVLTASTVTARLAVVGTVNKDTRAAYQILVRPPGTRTPLEDQRGLVRPNFQAGQYGGISMAQWDRIRGVTGVDLAAPIAMVGYTDVEPLTRIDVTDLIDPRLTRQILRIRPTWHADRGLSSAADAGSSYVYVTHRPVLWPKFPEGAVFGTIEPAFPGAAPCPDGAPGPYEVAEDGSRVPLCLGIPATSRDDLSQLNTPDAGSVLCCNSIVQVLPDGTFSIGGITGKPPQPRATIGISAPIPVLVAAVDPASEAALMGLDRAVVSGRYLDAGGLTTDPRSNNLGTLRDAPVMVATHLAVDGQVTVAVTRLSSVAADRTPPAMPVKALDAAPGVPLTDRPAGSLDDLYQAAIHDVPASPAAKDEVPIGLGEVVRVAGAVYDVDPDGTLRPHTGPPVSDLWPNGQIIAARGDGVVLPWLSHDTGFGAAQRYQVVPTSSPLLTAIRVGEFDPAKVSAFDPLASRPLQTYAPTEATGADPAARALLGNQPLLPSGNIGGYLGTSPSVLMSLTTLHDLQPGNSTPISAVRVRVAGVGGYDAASRERVRLVADEIHRDTGLDVDIVFGSSPAPQTVALAPGRFGRPALRLAEPWAKLNVAAHLIRAIDTKSAALFGLILVVCLLLLTNAVAAAVRDRRRDLAVLACFGWPRRRLTGLILAEVAIVGLAAGVLSAALAFPFGRVVGAQVSLTRALLAVPVALAVALAAGLWPAARAGRAHPGRALAPLVAKPGRPRRHPWTTGTKAAPLAGLALANLRRTPGRSVLGMLALGTGVAGLTVLAVIQRAFHGAAVGTLLGDAVTLQVRPVDLAAVLTTILLGVFAVADVLYLNIRQRATELAALRAMGWSRAALHRLITWEGALIGLLGAGTGSLAGLGAARVLFGHTAGLPTLVPVALVTAATGIALSAAAAAVPALMLDRRPIAPLLAEE